MSNKKYKPDNIADLIPYLVVTDIEKSMNLYDKAFGFKMTGAMKDDSGKIQHVEMQRGPISIMFCEEGAMGMNTKAPITKDVEESISLYCYCEDVDALHKQAVEAGMESKMEPHDTFWEDRMCALVDHNGYRWSFGTYLGK